MARDYEDLHDLDSLADDELRALVRERLREHNALDINDIEVSVDQGTIVLAGRVGTEGERRVAEHVVTDVLGIMSVRNEIVVDAIRRAESPVAMDEHLAGEEREEGLLLGDKPTQFEDGSAPADRAPDVDERLWGTTDVHDVIANGVPWIPPESPTQEGFAGTDSTGPDMGEDH